MLASLPLPRLLRYASCALVAAGLAVSVHTGPVVADTAAAPMTRQTVVDSTTVGLVTTPEVVTIIPAVPLRIGPGNSPTDLTWILRGTATSVIEELTSVIDDARLELGEQADATAFLLANVSSSCEPIEEVRVVRPGPSSTPRDVMVETTFVDDGVDRTCDPTTTVAVLSVAVADVPIGGADQAELVGFQQIERGGWTDLPAAMTLPTIRPGTTRVMIEYAGCRDVSAELVITTAGATAVGNQGDDSVGPMCVTADWYFAVFDVDRAALPAGVEIAGQVLGNGED